jgi:hypothetical protein
VLACLPAWSDQDKWPRSWRSYFSDPAISTITLESRPVELQTSFDCVFPFGILDLCTKWLRVSLHVAENVMVIFCHILLLNCHYKLPTPANVEKGLLAAGRCRYQITEVQKTRIQLKIILLMKKNKHHFYNDSEEIYVLKCPHAGSQSFLSVFPDLSVGTMATCLKCCHLPGEMLNLAAKAADRARKSWHCPRLLWTKFTSFFRQGAKVQSPVLELRFGGPFNKTSGKGALKFPKSAADLLRLRERSILWSGEPKTRRRRDRGVCVCVIDIATDATDATDERGRSTF